MTARRRRNSRGQGQQLRAELLSAGHRVLDRTGDPASVTIRRVVGMVGVAPPALYQHFRDRRAFLLALASDRFSSLPSHLADAAGRAGEEPFVKLRLGLAAFVSFAVQNPGHYRVLFDGVADLDGRAETDSLDAFERFVDTSYSPEPSDRVTRRHVTTALVALAHGYIQLALSGRRDARAAGHQALEVLDALCVGPLAIRGDSLEMEYDGLLCRHPGLGRTFAS